MRAFGIIKLGFFSVVFLFTMYKAGLCFKFYTKKPAVKPPEWIKPYPFNYNPENRPDPFKPVIKIKQLKTTKRKKPLSPLEEFEPTQLNLVGILWDPHMKIPPMALVELPNGKGYILKEGMRIGPEGSEVVAILKDRVIIVQTIVDLFGKKEKRQIILSLKTKK